MRNRNALYRDLVRDLNALRPARIVSLTMPAQVFFRPTEGFIEWMRSTWRGEMTYDVGAGSGETSRALKDVGLFIRALDLYPRDGAVFPVARADGAAYEYDRNSTVMLYRPSHGMFPLSVIEQAIEQRVRRVLYVGLRRNVVSDLGPYRRRFKRVLTEAGASGESVYQMGV